MCQPAEKKPGNGTAQAPKPAEQKPDRNTFPALLILDDERSEEYLRATPAPKQR